jgi:hypothetical protein
VRYRYYVSHLLLQRSKEAAGSVARVPAVALEKLVVEAARAPNPEVMADLSDREVVERTVARVIVRPHAIKVESQETHSKMFEANADAPSPATGVRARAEAAASAAGGTVISLPWSVPAFLSIKGVIIRRDRSSRRKGRKAHPTSHPACIHATPDPYRNRLRGRIKQSHHHRALLYDAKGMAGVSCAARCTSLHNRSLAGCRPLARANAFPADFQTLQLATLISGEFLRRGMVFTKHHAEKIAGEGRRLLNEDRGVYQYDQLIVLKNGNSRAVLIEAGVIVNRDEELILLSRARRDLFSDAVSNAVEKFCVHNKIVG